MAARNVDVIAIGECMVELARGGDGRFGFAYGGDTFNTALYMARCGVSVGYATQLGDDPYSAGILALAAAEHIDTALMSQLPGRMPGLYLIETTAAGERTFHYWRDRSPARELFDSTAAVAVADAMTRARMVYISGITLSLYSASGLDTLATAVTAARKAGAKIAMDGNYRSRGWGGDAARARTVMERFWCFADIALPTFDDEAMLWGDATSAETIARLRALDLGEIVVKHGPDGAVVAGGDHTAQVPIPERVLAIDTSAAGDSFNAAYLAARLAGVSAEAAALEGHRLAGVVVQHRGAIAPREATASVIVKHES